LSRLSCSSCLLIDIADGKSGVRGRRNWKVHDHLGRAGSGPEQRRLAARYQWPDEPNVD
jgi:hypothetical protein